ncbi:hypothetical protein IAT38_003593 [Cryptococcus sp. DSM 104549]
MGLNSPIPVRLEEETRKAAKILRSFVDVNNNGLDKVIPRSVLERAQGFAIFTVFKAGFLFSARAGSGIVIARLDDGSWSPPSAIGTGGLGFGGQAGAEVTDFLIVLNSKAAVASFMSAGSLTLGGNLSVAVGPLGRNAEGSGALNTKGRLAAMYSYSKTKGLFGGVSVEGSVIIERQDANRLAYGGNPTAKQILSGQWDPPDWAGPLIDQLEKATGLPGGQKWMEQDEEGEGGGMGGYGGYGGGYGSPGRSGTPEKGRGGGYVFGEGVGAQGSAPASSGRKRSGSLFGGASAERERANSSSSPSRRSSVLNPFSSGTASPRRGGKDKDGREHTSEAYNAGLTWDSSGPMGARSGSSGLRREGEVPAPFSYMNSGNGRSGGTGGEKKEKDLLNDWDSDPFRSKPPSASSSRDRTGNGNGHTNGGNDRDLLGQWDSNGHGLSASFSRLSTNPTTTAPTSRSRSDSRGGRTPFDDILEDPRAKPQTRGEPDYTPRETESSFARMDWAALEAQRGVQARSSAPASGRKSRPFSSYVASAPKASPSKGDFSPFEDGPVGRLRSNSGGKKAFEDYQYLARGNGGSGGRVPEPFNSPSKASHSRGYNASPEKPEIRLKPGLESTHDGYARAVALFDFPVGAEGDLGFKAGEVVVVLASVGSGDWWRGRATGGSGGGGREGIFPSSYVEVLDIPKDLRSGIERSELRKRVARNEFD